MFSFGSHTYSFTPMITYVFLFERHLARNCLLYACMPVMYLYPCRYIFITDLHPYVLPYRYTDSSSSTLIHLSMHMYIHISLHPSIHMHTFMCVCLQIYIHVWNTTCVPVYIHVHTYIFTCIYIYTHIYRKMHVFLHGYIWIFTYMHIYTYMLHAHIHKCMQT